MESRYQVIARLVAELETFEKATSGESFTYSNFINYLVTAENHAALHMRSVAGTEAPDVQQAGNNKETDIAILITYLYRYAKLYAKKALGGSPLQGLEDFSYLVILVTHDSLTKTELINKNAHEKTTGMETIKRLIRLRLIHQFSDETDRRSQRIAITEEGKAMLFSLFGKMGKVSLLMTEILSENEKDKLKEILSKLDHYHFDLFMKRHHIKEDE